MKRFTVRLPDKLHAEAVEKAKRELRSLNAIVTRLIEKWVAAEVDLEPPKRSEQQQED